MPLNNKTSGARDKASSILQRMAADIREIIYKTSIEVFIGAIGAIVIFAPSVYRAQKKSEGERSIAFSQLEEQQNPSGLTTYYSVANDSPMKVFESFNIARAKDDTHQTLARELEKRILPALREYTQISEYAQRMPVIARNALNELQGLQAAQKSLPAVIDHLGAAYKEDHVDTTHEEPYFETTQDDKGNTKTEMKWRTVYDFTTHYYDYFPQHGTAGATLLKDFVADHKSLDPTGRINVVLSLHENNRQAITKSMAKLFKDKTPSCWPKPIPGPPPRASTSTRPRSAQNITSCRPCR